MRAILKALLLLVICSQAWALGLADLTDKDASGGLREALVQGASKAVGQLGTSGGFMNNPKVKIGLPESLAPLEGGLRAMGASFIRAVEAAGELVSANTFMLEMMLAEQRLVDEMRRL